ncbi:hypothetical protein Y032_0223g2658 [Ancylostoma ceylanicum]|uniref:Uncharacterized protein n=1 Tax=Ancylostoma ceylanicum TaxID=53326 RepID=A0A016SHF2_9BILA|nr:hypothetical protein Y032_0223g2658 [Ancylostoma ceylanicum]
MRVTRCDKAVLAFGGVELPGKLKKCTETCPFLGKGYAGIHRGFLSYMPSFIPYTYLLIIPFPTLCPLRV